MLLAAAILFVISGVVNLYEMSYSRSLRVERIERIKKKNAELTDLHQKYLDETAAKITNVSINQTLLSQIKSYVFGKMPNTKLYLWMSDTSGNFLFGVPAPEFSRLNKGFDKFSGTIEKDGYYLDRNDFLLKLIDEHEKVKFIKLAGGGLEGGLRQRRAGSYGSEKNRWRFYQEYFAGRATGLALSSPVLDENNQAIGDLYLKVNDSALNAPYVRARPFLTTTLFEGSHVVFAISAMFLWFLLPTWVYTDARERDVKNIYLWIVLTLVSMGFGAIIYLITRPQALTSFHCPDCQGELNGTKAFCPHCGFDLSSTFCPECQYPIKPEWGFCPNCRCDIKRAPKDTIPTGEEEKQ